MTTQLLANELANLVQESKRKHNDLRQAAERSLEELKALKGMSEAQACAELSQKPGFINPLIIACGTKSPKFTSPAIVCLQRLVAARALPRSKLDQVLEALRGAAEAGSSGSLSASAGSSASGAVVGGAPVVDAQLKILQALPALLANYANDISGDLLVATLDVCFVLQACRNGIVNNTAAATLQQLIVAVFDKVVVEDKSSGDADDAVPTGEVETKDGVVKLKPAALDAYRVFNDLCLMTDSLRPSYLGISKLPQTFGLELIESVLTQHAGLFATHQEQAFILRARVMPLIISTLKRKPNFATTVRLARIMYTLLRRHLLLLPAESGDALEILTQLLDSDTAQWKRAVCMEVFRGVFAEPALLRRIFTLYDAAKDGRKPILKTLTATLVRLSTEKPAIIGLGHQSSIPVSIQSSGSSSADQAMLETGIISGSSATDYGSSVNTGVSTAWSSVRVPCIDQLDKTEAPPIPESYIYSLILTCISSLSEGMVKFILPLTVPAENRVRRRGTRDGPGGGRDSPAPTPAQQQLEPTDAVPSRERSASFKKNPIPLNPLANPDHPMYADVQICAAIVDECWPAILATCSTFLYAALDSEYYHGLVRAFQKFAHVAGLLQLPTPRDAFLTTLGKAAVPPNVFTACLNSGPAKSSTQGSADGQAVSSAGNPGGSGGSSAGAGAGGILSNARGLLSVESLTSGPGSERGGRQSSVSDPNATTLNTRNLLCLRALLNLGIALGPTLGASWSIIIETLQQADFVLFCSGKTPGKTPLVTKGPDQQAEVESNVLLNNFATEVRAVETAASRLIESTIDFPNSAFVEVVEAICCLLERRGGNDNNSTAAAAADDKADQLQTGQGPSSRPHTPLSGSRTPTQGQHRRVNSTGGAASSSGNQEDQFALAKLGHVATINLERLLAFPPDVSGWTPLVSELIRELSSSTLNPTVRARAADILVRLVLDAANLAASLDAEPRGRIQLGLLGALRDAVLPLQAAGRASSVAHHAADAEIHRVMLDGLNSLLENCGEGIVSGWEIAFQVIGSIFFESKLGIDDSQDGSRKGNGKGRRQQLFTRSAKLIRSAFNSLQLICSDFLSSLPNPCFLILVDTLYMFCSQEDDLNIALTTVTFFWVLSDFLSSKNQSLAITADLVSTSANLASMAADKTHGAADAALWMLLLLRLTTVTSDERLELRNSAIQTLLRIFDAHGEKLSPEAWTVCVENVIFKLLKSIEHELKDAHNVGSDKHQAAAPAEERNPSDWDDTAVVVLTGVADLLASYLDVLTAHASFDSLWKELLSRLVTLLDFHILAVNTATFKALGQILEHTHAPAPPPPPSNPPPESSSGAGKPALSKASIDAAWDLWSRGIPLSSDPSSTTPSITTKSYPGQTDNQDSFVAYVSALRHVYRLIQVDLDVSRVERMLALLRQVIQAASTPSYTSDIEFVTPLQGQIIEVIRMVRTDVAGVPSAIISQVSQIVQLAFAPEMLDNTSTDKTTQQQQQQPRRSYVAMAKSAMALLDGLLLRHATDSDIFASGALSWALSALARPISLKYSFPTRTTKSPCPWRIATSASLSILEATLPRFVALPSSPATPATADSLWELIVTIASGIISADCDAASPQDNISLDEEFDITSYLRLRALIIPALGTDRIHDNTRARFAQSLYKTSVIHSGSPAEGLVGQESGGPITEDQLTKPRRGRTSDPLPARRAAMAYICLDELFALASARTSSSSSSSHPDDSAPTAHQPAILVLPPTPLTTTALIPTSSQFPLIHHPDELPAALNLRISRAVAPYLILRCALALRAYAADQPLRGRMPQPASQRRELTHILERLVSLRSEPGAIPDLSRVESETRKHLFRLYPLIVAVGSVVGWRGAEADADVGALVSRAFDVVGGEFGS